MPDLTGLSKADVATASSLTLALHYINCKYTGAAAAACTTCGNARNYCSLCTSKRHNWYGTATLTFDAAGSDVWATGSVIESRASSEVDFDTSCR